MNLSLGKFKESFERFWEIDHLKKILGSFYTQGILLLLVTIFIYSVCVLTAPVKIQDSDREVIIESGLPLSAIAESLYSKKIIEDKSTFIIAAHLMFKTRSLKAGHFILDDVKNYRQLVQTLSTPYLSHIKITIPEGYQSKEIAKLLASNLNLSYDDFIKQISNKEFMEKLGIDAPNLEGYLFPDTYHFYETETAQSVITKMVRRLNEVINDSIKKEINKTGMNLHEVLTLASIIEGECMLDAERPIVASVYINRLKKGMRLEADPTIQYIIPDGPRRLYKKDLKIQSPYNTYIHRGLPPGPISNPGLKSILAAIKPAKTNYLYMVANGDGSHTFTSNYSEFLRAKRKFQEVRQKMASEANGASKN